MYRQYQAKSNMASTGGIKFKINGAEHNVPSNLPATYSLNEYIRHHTGFKGTKVMCREAGCGCCSVAITRLVPHSDKLETCSVQSCLTPLYSVDGWQITTVEGLGNHRDGFHPIQERIAKFNGTQCGYCTPGMVMNMYGLLHQNPNMSLQDVEDNFDGNLCRCTGYRPILDSMKSFTGEWNVPDAKPIDIEDLNKELCPKTGEVCTGNYSKVGGSCSLDLQIDGVKWYRPTSLSSLGQIMSENKEQKIRLFIGNTASGIFKDEGPFDAYVDLHRVSELFVFEKNNNGIEIGGGTSLTSLLNTFKTKQNDSGLKYFAAMHRHLKFVANVMVRNAGSIAGNLMIKQAHPEFPSDIFTMFEGVGASVKIFDSATAKEEVMSLLEFLKLEMKGKVITTVTLPSVPDDTVFKSFKITPRWQNAHAYVNAAFNIQATQKVVKGRPSLVFGGVNSSFVHATKTEEFLKDKLLSETIIKDALKTLRDEVKPDNDPLNASPKYRVDLAVNLLYKVLLGIYCPSNLKLRSGPDYLHRPISSGLQTYQEMKAEFPLKQAMPKKTAEFQASGEAQFINDIPTYQQELFAVYVLSDVSSATIESIDASKALNHPGVVKFLQASDVPGSNTLLPQQEVFASKEVSFAGQPVGAILAESYHEAVSAAKLVEIKYSKIREPIMNIRQSIEKGKEYPFPNGITVTGQPDEELSKCAKVVEGECEMGTQYHFFMETQVSLAIPSEDGIDLYPASQCADFNQTFAAGFINKPMNYINVTVPRIGGGFGGKGADSLGVSCVAVLGTFLTGRPVRMSLDLSTNIRLGAKRPAIYCKYKAGCTADGDVKVIDMDYYADMGFAGNSAWLLTHMIHYIDACYFIPHWNIRGHPMMTNKQVVTAVRAPGSVPSSFIIETIMEHVAKTCGRHPIIVKELNLYEKGQSDPFGHKLENCTVREVWRRLKDTAEVEGRMRQVDAFNQENLWKKRGITMTSCKYGMGLGSSYSATVSIYAADGTIAVSQGGVEMGQGLYTKVVQGVAQVLGVSMDTIKVRPNQNIIAPNSSFSGGSTSSELAVLSAMEAAKTLKERMQPIKDKYPDDDWRTLCKKCNGLKIDLSAKHRATREGGKPHFSYFTYSVAICETELDILTGESHIRRVDIMNDFGESLNPTIDVGQVEGGFIMGLGAYLSEDIIHDEATGRILNDGTWEYKPPTTKDIPIDWRIHFLPDTPNPTGILSSKAVAEPPTSLGMGVLLANKLAVESARKELMNADDFIPTVAPFTVDRVQQSVGLTIEHLQV